MEMKYIKDQDTGEIFYPMLHSHGICDLDIDETSNELVSKEFPLTSSAHFSTSSLISYKNYIKMVYVSIKADLKSAAVKELQANGYFTEDLPAGFPLCTVRLNLICKNSNGLSPYCTAYGIIEDKKITVHAITLEPTYDTNTDGIVEETKVKHSFESIIGCGYSC